MFLNGMLIGFFYWLMLIADCLLTSTGEFSREFVSQSSTVYTNIQTKYMEIEGVMEQRKARLIDTGKV